MNILKSIQKKKTDLDGNKPFLKSFLTNMDEWYKVELTYTSNAIEGNTLTRQETALIIEKGITVEGKSIREHLEAVNHGKAFEYIQHLKLKKIKDINEQIILNIRSIILENIDRANAGQYRNTPVRTAGSRVTMPNPLQVPDLMKTFVNWLKQSEGDPVETAVKAHFTLVTIHPFTDGNGRTARLLMNLILIIAGYPPTIIRKEERKKYIEVIEKGQLTDDLGDYYSFMYRLVERSLDIYLDTFQSKKKTTQLAKKLMKISELAKTTGETVPTIRFWTNEGLIKVAEFTRGGYQLYSQQAVGRVKKIKKLKKEKRLSIKELKQLLD